MTGIHTGVIPTDRPGVAAGRIAFRLITDRPSFLHRAGLVYCIGNELLPPTIDIRGKGADSARYDGFPLRSAGTEAVLERSTHRTLHAIPGFNKLCRIVKHELRRFHRRS